MDDNRGSKITSIRQIVKFKAILKKWQLVALTPKSCTPTPFKRDACGNISPEISSRLRTSNMHHDSDEESCQSLEMPSDVPKGYLAVYVVPELRRFIIPTSYLGAPVFKVLLEKTEEEFGFDHSGGLTIPCEIETFKYLLQCAENHRKNQANQSNAGETSSSV